MEIYFKKMNCEDFANFLLTMKNGDTVEFACNEVNKIENDEDRTMWDVEAFYFVKIMEVPEYDSRFFLIDYAGGEEAFAIPLNGYSDKFDGDDESIVRSYVRRFFDECYNIANDGFVYVEIKY